MNTWEAKGTSGQVSFDGRSVTISRKGWRARATVGKGEKRIPVNMITGVTWKPAALLDGFIRFETAAAAGTRSHFGGRTDDAWNDENSVTFARRHMAAFDVIRREVEKAVAAVHQPLTAASPATPVSVADELAKLAGLLDQGVLTQAEFDSQKARLLAWG